MSATRVNTTELRITFVADTPSDALVRAERELRSEGYVPKWVAVTKQMSEEMWSATICGSRVLDEPEPGAA